MIKALESSRQAMNVQMRRHEVIANNLANARTPGFRRELTRVRQTMSDPSTAQSGQARLRPSLLAVEGYQDMSSGPLESTGNPLDLALVGEGWFVIETPEGERCSRNGAFSISSEGTLLHSSGNPVMTDGGPITFTEEPSFLPDGGIMDGERLVGRLLIRQAGAGSWLVKEGDNLYRPEGEMEELAPEQTRINSGSLEGSNVDAVREMVDMIRAFRAYEMAQRAAQSADETLKTAVERVGDTRP